jgi:hypothetical protein
MTEIECLEIEEVKTSYIQAPMWNVGGLVGAPKTRGNLGRGTH